MSYPLIEAQPPLKFIPPKLNLAVLRATQMILPPLARQRTGIVQVQGENLSTLVQLYQQFQQGKIRFLMAFRHPSPQDPYPLLYLLSRLVPQAAKQEQISLSPPIHSHFIYDRGIPLWAGQWTAWLFPRLGGTPIHRGKFDRVGLRSIRELFANGKYPLLGAPEGATNGHNEIVSPLEPGIAQMGFWCLEDLQKRGRSEEVLIVPLGLQYRYLTPPWQAIEELLGQLERDVAIKARTPNKEQLYERLFHLGEQLLTLMEDFYQRFYHQHLDSSIDLSQRLQTLLDIALRVAEQYFGLTSKGTVIDRCRRLEQAGWDYIYREDLADANSISPVERGLANRLAEEANLRLWHMRIVENFVAVTGKYVQEKPTAERYTDTLLQMWDLIAKIKGINPARRPQLGQRIAQITVGNPISVSEQWQRYQESRRSARQVVMDLTRTLQVALEDMISKDDN